MLAALRRRLTYANVMATVAVFVALGGTSYAALSITGRDVRNGSLTGADVRDGSVTGADVKNRSLACSDFKAGQLPAGAAGPAGPKGAGGGVSYRQPAQSQVQAVVPYGTCQNLTQPVKLAADDEVRLMATQSSPTTLQVRPDEFAPTSFGMTWIGPAT